MVMAQIGANEKHHTREEDVNPLRTELIFIFRFFAHLKSYNNF